MRSMEPQEKAIASLAGAHRRSTAVGMPRAAIACAAVWSLHAATGLVRSVLRRMWSLRVPVAVTN